MTDTAAIEERLTERLSELRARLTRVNADLAEPLNADSSEQAVEVEDYGACPAQQVPRFFHICTVFRN